MSKLADYLESMTQKTENLNIYLDVIDGLAGKK